MAQIDNNTLDLDEAELTIRYLRSDELQLLEKFEKLTSNFKKAILGMMDIFFEYQEKYYE